ncbi:hypothetical protein ABH966_003060 [Lysinibacillus sp. RC46]
MILRAVNNHFTVSIRKALMIRGIEATNNALAKETTEVLPRVWTGVDSKGVTRVGYFENGKLTSLFPTTPTP